MLSWPGIFGSPKKKGLFKKTASQSVAPSGGNFPVALSFGDDGTPDMIYLLLDEF
jgi:hypothetical protein